MDREQAVKTVATLWTHYRADMRSGNLHEAAAFRRKAERLMDQFIPAITMEEALPKQRRVELQFVTDDPYKIKHVIQVLKVSEKRKFIKIHTAAMQQADENYCLDADFSGKVKNVEFLLEHFNNLPEELEL